MKRFVSALLAVSAILAFASPALTQDSAPLRVGITPIPPFGGTPPGGFYFDLMNEISERTGLTFEYQPLPFGELIPALAGNSIDIIAGPFSPANAGREAGLVYTAPVLLLRETLVVPATDTTAYAGLPDLAGKTVGVLAGVASYIAALEAAGATVRTYALPAEAIAALQAGETAAFLQSHTQFAYAQEVQGLFPDVRIVDTYVPVILSRVALVTRADTDIVGDLHAALETLRADGTLAALSDEWKQIPLE